MVLIIASMCPGNLTSTSTLAAITGLSKILIWLLLNFDNIIGHELLLIA